MRILTLTLLALAALAAPAAAQDAPSLSLIAADSSVRLSTFELDEGMDLGLWVAATGGEFQIRLQRPDYGRWQAAHVDSRTGAPLRSIPRGLLDARRGLRSFIRIRFLNAKGKVAGRRTLTFCPGTAERVNGDGPATPTYLPMCGTVFPFARGAAWGIDAGWAGSVAQQFAELGGPPQTRRLRLRPGRYRAVAEIAPAYRRLFAIPLERARASVRVRVFGERGRHRREHGARPLVPVPFANAAAASEPLTAQTIDRPDPATLPDLVALPPWQVRVRRRGRRDMLGFAASPWNAGPAAMVVEGYRKPGHDVMDAYQYFFDAEGEATGRAPAGSMEFHDKRGHFHWHFLQFVAYRMLRASGRSVVRAHKQSFCLAATDLVDPWVPGAERVPDVIGLGFSSCGGDRSIWIREQLPAGWGDTYPPNVAGQEFDITRVPNGRYLLEMHVNPRGELHEVSTANNIARRTVVLSGKRGKRRVRVLPWHGIRR